MTVSTRTAIRAAVLALTAAVAVLVGGLGGAAPASAEDTVTWSVQPSSTKGPDGRTELTYQVKPGTTISDRVAVSNYSDQAATFRVYAADATSDYDTGAFTLIGADQASVDLGGWTSVDSATAVCADTGDQRETECAARLGKSVRIEPGERAELPFTITVPHDATPGDHAAGIVAALRLEGAAKGKAVRLEQRVGTRIYLRVAGDLRPELSVTGAVTGFDGVANPLGDGTQKVAFDITNSGNVRLSATPKVQVTGPFGIVLGSASAKVVENLVPGASTHVEVDVSDVPPALLLTGKITVTPQAADKSAKTALPAPTTADARTWAVPWPAALLVVVLVGGIAAAVWWRRRSARLLAAELADYTEQVRAQTLAEAGVTRHQEDR